MTKAPREHSVLVSAELRWMVQLRWCAAAAIIAGAIAHAMWAEWAAEHGWTVALGGVILLYNALFVLSMSRAGGESPRMVPMLTVAGAQIVFDLVALTLLVLWTGGVSSPLLGLFVLHMVLASLLLPPIIAYAGAVAAVGLMLAGLSLTGQWPRESASVLLACGWALTLLLTVFLTGRITEQLRRREAEWRDQRRHTQAILDTAADGIITIDEAGTIQSANPATARIFGYDASELIGREIGVLMPDPDREQHDGYLAAYLRTGRAKIIGIGREVLGRRKDGTAVHLDLAVSEVRTNGSRFFTGIVRDISERKERESQLAALNEQILRQQQALIQSEKMAAMGTMAAGIAHEIANPLANMDCLLQLARRQFAGAEISSGTLASMQEQIGRIERIARELTAFAHPEGAEWRLMSPSEIVRDALHLLRFEHRLRKVDVQCNCFSKACDVHGQPQAMQQVLVNVILNALDAMEDVPEPRLLIRSGCDEEWCRIEIEDNGYGIEAEKVERIFEPFFTTKPAGRGTGLGLSISATLVQRHGGRCEVDSTPGRGTTFRILLPAHSVPVAGSDRSDLSRNRESELPPDPEQASREGTKSGTTNERR
jgi:two-component system, LuxR family, sensor kinase FixL